MRRLSAAAEFRSCRTFAIGYCTPATLGSERRCTSNPSCADRLIGVVPAPTTMAYSLDPPHAGRLCVELSRDGHRDVYSHSGTGLRPVGSPAAEEAAHHSKESVVPATGAQSRKPRHKE